MRNKKFFLLIISLFFFVIFLIGGVGYFINLKKPREKQPSIIEISEEKTRERTISTNTLNLPKLLSTTTNKELKILETENNQNSILNLETKKLFNKELTYGDLIYPYIYVYDPTENILKYFNLENNIYKEIYKPSSSIYNLSVSPSRELISFFENNKLNILHLNQNLLKVFNEKIIDFKWKDDTFYFFSFNNLKGGFIGKISDINKNPIILDKIGFIDAKIEIFNNLLLIYANSLNSVNSPIFALNILKPSGFSLYLEPKNYYSLISSNDSKYLFVSYQDESWKSKIINQNKEELINFNWGTLKEKCSFDSVLICGVPLNQKVDINDWYKLKKNYQDKIIIFDPETKKIKELILNDSFDIIKPKLTPMGIIFWNRNDANFYIINLKQFPFY